jgi:hypothetical protein
LAPKPNAEQGLRAAKQKAEVVADFLAKFRERQA